MHSHPRVRAVGLKLQLVALLALIFSFLPGVVPMAAADGPGEFVIHPKDGVTASQIEKKYGVRALFTITGTKTLVVSSATAQATSAAINRDMLSGTAPVVWWELSSGASDPRAKDDSGADPYCPPLPDKVQPIPVASTDDSGADGQRCTRAVQDGQRLYEGGYTGSKLNLGPAWNKTRGAGVTIAVIDTKVDTRHPLLAGRTLPSIDLVPLSPLTNGATTVRVAGYGTFVAGLALRVAPEARILPIRVLSEDGRGTTALVVEGIRRATNAGAKVINLSLSTYTSSRALQEAVTYARQKGAIVVAAYGNESLKNPAVYPADLPGVVSVIATDDADVRARFSNDGRKAVVAAPGVNVVSSWQNGTYAMGSGTSYAAPLVAGQAALIFASGMKPTPQSVTYQIEKTADDIGQPNGSTWAALGYGRSNVGRSVTQSCRTSGTC